MAEEPDPTGEQQAAGNRFKPGQSGNPEGRPKGSRNKLGEAFVTALHDDFSEHGADAIAKVRATDPSTYMRVVASLLPKEFKIETTSDLTDEQLDARIRALADAIGLEVGTGGPPGRAPAPDRSQPPGAVPPVH